MTGVSEVESSESSESNSDDSEESEGSDESYEDHQPRLHHSIKEVDPAHWNAAHSVVHRKTGMDINDTSLSNHDWQVVQACYAEFYNHIESHADQLRARYFFFFVLNSNFYTVFILINVSFLVDRFFPNIGQRPKLPRHRE